MNILPSKYKEKLARLFFIRAVNVFLLFILSVLFVVSLLSFAWFSFLKSDLQRIKLGASNIYQPLEQTTNDKIDSLILDFVKIKDKTPLVSSAIVDIQNIFSIFSQDVFVDNIKFSIDENKEVLSVAIYARVKDKDVLLALIKALKNQDFAKNLDIQKTLLSLTRSEDLWSFMLKFDYAKSK